MNSYYEFISKQQDQMLILSFRACCLNSQQVHRFGTWGKVIDRCGDVMINFGSWLKNVSNAPIKEKSVSIYSRN